MTVIFSPEVTDYLADLIEVLYLNDYFGFKESAKKYVIDLAIDIKTTLYKRISKPAPSYFDRYGKNMSYAVFRKNIPPRPVSSQSAEIL
jgi:hypothetical protein